MTHTHPNNHSAGFTTVEMLVALFIGVLFIAAGYQLFMILTHDGAESRDKTIASNLAATELNKLTNSSATCNSRNIPTIYASDDFNRANTTSSLGTATAGGNWTTRTGVWRILDNKAQVNATADAQQVTLDTGQTEYIAEATIGGIGSNAYPGMMFRWSSANTYYWVEFLTNTNRFSLNRFIGGSRSTLYTSGTVAISGGQARLGVSLVEVSGGTQISITINGTQIHQMIDTAANRPTGTHVGFRYGAGSTGSVLTQPYDDIIVTGHQPTIVSDAVQDTIPAPTTTKLVDPEISSTISWPFGCDSSPVMKKIEVGVTYGEPDNRKEVKHAKLVRG